MSSSSPSRLPETCGGGSSVPGTDGAAGPVTPSTASKACWHGNLEHLSPDQFAKIMDTLDRDRYGQEIAAAWIPRRNCMMP